MSIASRAASGAWASRTTFVLALTAMALGLGNFWRFSYLVATEGGGAFLAIYLLTLLAVAVPVLIAELVIGSHGRAHPAESFAHASQRSAASPLWTLLGWWMVICSILILAYYAVVAGWALAYVVKMDAALLADASAAMVGAHFSEMLNDPGQLVYWQTLFLLAVFGLSALGIHRGLGVLFWFVVPLALVVMVVLIGFALEYGDMAAAGRFLFSSISYDFTAGSVLVAMGHAFFTLGIGLGVGVAFGAYAPEKIPLGRTVLAVAVIDSFVALFAGIAIFPLIFASNVEPSMGPSLLFVSLPYAFSNLPDGETFGVLFFLLVAVVALASMVAVAEVAMAYLVERLRLRRPLAALLLGVLTWLLAMSAAMSFSIWADVSWFGSPNLFLWLDRLTAEIMMPISALLVALFVGYALSREVLRVEMYRESDSFFFLWRACLRYIAPPAIIVVMFAAAIESL